MTAEIVNLAVVRKMRGLLDDGTVVPFASMRTARADAFIAAVAGPPTHPWRRGQAVRHKLTKRLVGRVIAIHERPGLPGTVASLILDTNPNRLLSPDDYEPVPEDDFNPPPAA
ncbi:hypothetical protein FRZ44_38380 [Hypericibacter terrae]|uniref:Uncharacterized protein n=1 Tax=Hypericibacter terrae TaxID=2602015 RepID=A0A5J6MMW0_9PROT|nr:hypothetical protein [Hypericibacter terrae]QEX18531.1 hypothetical protein FRZ44_38380 [Hypericibacter terrae]